jgi:hypothetical protein
MVLQIKDWKIESWTYHLKEHDLKYSKMDKKNPKRPFLMRVKRIKVFHIGLFSTANTFYRRNFLKNKFYTKMCCSFNLQEEIVLSLIIIKLDDTTPTPVLQSSNSISCCVELKSEKLGYVILKSKSWGDLIKKFKNILVDVRFFFF